MMGRDSVRISFFKAFVERMRKEHPDFGSCCYVDSTPLPNDIDNNPFNALCSHGVESASVQTRLVLVLDEGTGLPVWYDVIPGNVLDISTIMTVVNGVSVSLDITINSLVLDAGYISKEVVHAFHNGTAQTFIARMPARRGFPFKTLYHEFRTSLDKGKYRFLRGGHVYFGKRKEIDLFGEKVFAYVYVNKNNALLRERSDCRITRTNTARGRTMRRSGWPSGSVTSCCFPTGSSPRRSCSPSTSDVPTSRVSSRQARNISAFYPCPNGVPIR